LPTRFAALRAVFAAPPDIIPGPPTQPHEPLPPTESFFAGMLLLCSIPVFGRE
jgi:hypothetical protein